MRKSESKIQQEIMLALGSRPDVRIFRNQVGFGYIGNAERHGSDVFIRNARGVRMGLCAGSADLIGWKTIQITGGMVGSAVAQFLSVEVKNTHGRVATNQENWMVQVRNAGGLAVVARSSDEIVNL